MKRSTSTLVFLAALLLGGVQAAEAAHYERLEALEAVYRNDGAAAALPGLEDLLVEFEQKGDRIAQVRTLRLIGECHWRLGDFESSEAALAAAFTLLGDRPEQRELAKVLNAQGLLAWDRGDYPEATAHFQSVYDIALDLGAPRMRGAALNNLSLVADEQGRYMESIGRYEEALELFREIGSVRGEGDVLANLGGVHLLLGRFRKAQDYYQAALAISTTEQSKPAMSQDHGNIALSLLGQGRTGAALKHFEQALTLSEAAGIRQDHAFWLRGRANAWVSTGRYDLALADYRQALTEYETIGAQAELLETARDFGELQLLLGDAGAAERLFRQSLEIAEEIGMERGITSSLLLIGDLNVHREQFDAAIDVFERALNRAEISGNSEAKASALLRLAGVRNELGELKKAIHNARHALSITRENGMVPLEAEAHYTLGESLRQGAELARARAEYEAGLAHQASISPELEWQIHYGLARTSMARGDRDAAVHELNNAIRLIESLRAHLSERRYRGGYVRDRHQVYIDLVRLLLELGNTEAAFSAAERLRAQSYVALLEETQNHADQTSDAKRAAELQERIRHLRNVLAEEQRKERIERRQSAVAAFSSELNQAEGEYQDLLDAGLSPPALGGLQVPSGSDTAALLRANEMLVEFVVDRDAVMLFFVSPHGVGARTVPLGREDLRSKVDLLRELIQQPENALWQKPALSLGVELITPLLEFEGFDESSHLYVVAHDALHYLPFSALLVPTEAGGEPLIERLTVSYLPSAVALRQPTSSPRSRSSGILVMAPDRSGLKYTRAEAQSIDRLFQPRSRLVVGPAATETLFRGTAASHDRIHLATHGYFNHQNPLLSGLELEPDGQNDGLLELHEIISLDLNAELVSLSACETGLSSGYFSTVPVGDDFVGLTRAFLAAGSRSVLATLWQVDDRSTGILMEDFYRQLHENSEQSKARRLANAQRSLRASSRYAHPFFWAPFTMVGSDAPLQSHSTRETTL